MIGVLLAAAFGLTSPAFSNGTQIPKRFTCDGAGVSPPLRWTAPPPGTRVLALSVEDPDAPGGTFVHWTGWNLRPTVRRLATGAHLPIEGTNSAGTRGYTGPCPPAGPAHHYVFRLYALKAKLRLRAGARPAAFDAALRGRILSTARLVGRYGRSV
jgi:Raf kinase inhibitor-like YbhB/YbcL family protein